MRGNSTLRHALPKRIFTDAEQDKVTIYAQMDGAHHTDLTIPDWITFDEVGMVFTGKAPDVEVTTNYTLLLTGYDPSDNFNTTTFTIEVTPNGVCWARQNHELKCEAEQWCTFTIEPDDFVEPNQDELAFFLQTQIKVPYLRYSTINSTLFGYPTEVLPDPLELDFVA